MPKRHNRRYGAMLNNGGWNPANDSEWRYRKTLDKDERDHFDAQDGLEQTLVVSEWVKAGEPKQHDIKFKMAELDAATDAAVAEVMSDGTIDA